MPAFHLTGTATTVPTVTRPATGSIGGRMTGLWMEVKGVPDLLQPDLCGRVLHFMDKPAEVANIIRVQLQVAVPTAFDP